MVRRLPVLQSSSSVAEPPFGLVRGALLAVLLALLTWAALLWGLLRFGPAGVALAFFAACGVSGAVLGQRVVAAQRPRFGAVAAPATAGCTWALAVFGGAFESWEIAVAALGALLGLSAAGFGAAIFGLLRRQRAARGVRH